MRLREKEFEQSNVRIFVVTFDANFLARAYVNSTGLQWPLLLDVDRKLYQAYGLDRLSWWQHFSPVSIARYLRLMARGYFPGQPGSDFQQLGGDVLIDPDGMIRFLYRSLSPHDRPDVDQILNVVAFKRQE